MVCSSGASGRRQGGSGVGAAALHAHLAKSPKVDLVLVRTSISRRAGRRTHGQTSWPALLGNLHTGQSQSWLGRRPRAGRRECVGGCFSHAISVHGRSSGPPRPSAETTHRRSRSSRSPSRSTALTSSPASRHVRSWLGFPAHNAACAGEPLCCVRLPRSDRCGGRTPVALAVLGGGSGWRRSGRRLPPGRANAPPAPPTAHASAAVCSRSRSSAVTSSRAAATLASRWETRVVPGRGTTGWFTPRPRQCTHASAS
jgi:hypothetical protein